MADRCREFVVLVVVLIGCAATPARSDDPSSPNRGIPAPVGVATQDWVRLDPLWQPSQVMSAVDYTTSAPNMAQAPRAWPPAVAASGSSQLATASGQVSTPMPPAQPMMQPPMPPMAQPPAPPMPQWATQPPTQPAAQPMLQPSAPPMPQQPMVPQAVSGNRYPPQDPRSAVNPCLVGGAVCGRLLNKGRPLVNCNVVIVPLQDVDGAIRMDEDRKPLSTVTDENGVFHLEGVPAGGYKLTWLPEGQNQWIRRISMRPDVHVRYGETTTLKEIRIALQTIN